MDSSSLLKQLSEVYQERVFDGKIITDVATVSVNPDNWVSICQSLRDDKSLFLHSISNFGAIDFREKLGGFQLVLTVFSHKFNHKITIKTLLPAKDDDSPIVGTISGVWPSAEWFEREMAELFGIVFQGHPDPRRLLLDDDWDEGYPMRRGWSGKDFVVKPEI